MLPQLGETNGQPRELRPRRRHRGTVEDRVAEASQIAGFHGKVVSSG